MSVISIVIAVFGMRLLLPLVIVWAAAGLPPLQAFELAMNPPPDDAAYFPDGSPSYETLLTDAHPLIASFGGMFLLMLFLSWLFEERERTWLTWLERPLARAGRLDAMAVLVSCVTLLIVSETLAEDAETVLFSGLLGLVTYLAVNGLGTLFENSDEEEIPQDVDHDTPMPRAASPSSPASLDAASSVSRCAGSPTCLWASPRPISRSQRVAVPSESSASSIACANQRSASSGASSASARSPARRA